MEAPKSLRRPINWQDFETLCKKLWGEIWNCPEIKKNGRTGQQQNGVDIVGMPFGEDQYYGIQCKGKDKYTHKQFTEEEITEEITKAKQFQPPLKKLYFATTAVKDAAIEEFVRKKNIDNKSKGLFEIHIFSWEDIVDLIDENRQTHDWYLKNQGFKTTKSVSVTFQNDVTELVLKPKFKQTITKYKLKEHTQDEYDYLHLPFLRQQKNIQKAVPILVHSPLSSTKVNLSYARIYFRIRNTGSATIEEYKMSFHFEGEVLDLTDSNESGNLLSLIRLPRPRNLFFWKEDASGRIVPEKNILVGDDVFASDDLYLKPAPKDHEILVKWKLISRDFKDEGTLKLIIKPDIEIETDIILVEDPSKAGTDDVDDFEDVFVEKEED